MVHGQLLQLIKPTKKVIRLKKFMKFGISKIRVTNYLKDTVRDFMKIKLESSPRNYNLNEQCLIDIKGKKPRLASKTGTKPIKWGRTSTIWFFHKQNQNQSSHNYDRTNKIGTTRLFFIEQNR